MALLMLGSLLMQAQTKRSLTSYVNPMIGTAGMGHTFPGACAPFGVVQLSPETDTIPQVSRSRFFKIGRAHV